MKHLKFTLLPMLFLLFGVLVTSCESENLQEEEKSEKVTNYDLIKKNLEIYQESQGRKGGLLPSYFCSEQGGTYTSYPYVNHSVYLNDFYDPTKQSVATYPVKYATWMTNLERWLEHDFNDTNPSGSTTSIDIYFDVYGANGNTYLDATNGNRAYNEFVCQVMDQLSLTNVSQLDNYEFAFDITVDYLLCCNGSSCCDPVLFASGIAYLN